MKPLALNRTRYAAVPQGEGRARALLCLPSPAACTGLQTGSVKIKVPHPIITSCFSNFTFIHAFATEWLGKRTTEERTRRRETMHVYKIRVKGILLFSTLSSVTKEATQKLNFTPIVLMEQLIL